MSQLLAENNTNTSACQQQKTSIDSKIITTEEYQELLRLRSEDKARKRAHWDHGYTCIPNTLMRDERLDAYQFRILCVILSYGYLEYGKSFAVGYMSKVAKISRFKCSTSLNKLTEIGYIKKIREYCKKTSTPAEYAGAVKLKISIQKDAKGVLSKNRGRSLKEQGVFSQRTKEVIIKENNNTLVSGSDAAEPDKKEFPIHKIKKAWDEQPNLQSKFGDMPIGQEQRIERNLVYAIRDLGFMAEDIIGAITNLNAVAGHSKTNWRYSYRIDPDGFFWRNQKSDRYRFENYLDGRFKIENFLKDDKNSAEDAISDERIMKIADEMGIHLK